MVEGAALEIDLEKGQIVHRDFLVYQRFKLNSRTIFLRSSFLLFFPFSERGFFGFSLLKLPQFSTLHKKLHIWRVVRVVEGAALEMLCA